MPKKRQSIKSFKPSTAATPGPKLSSGTTNKSPRGVNELLADLRRTAPGSSNSHYQPNTPTVPPAIREILQIPETPTPAPRRPGRVRYDGQGRRLPPGPPPPRSWLASRCRHPLSTGLDSRLQHASLDAHGSKPLPGARLPARGSLIDLVLRAMAREWAIQRTYNYYYLYYLPSHLKPALIRYVGLASAEGISAGDLRTILKPPGVDDQESLGDEAAHNEQVTYLDLTGSVGHSIKLKEVTTMLFPSDEGLDTDELQDSWERAATPPRPTGPLVPCLTHMSLALRPGKEDGACWKQLIAFSSKAQALTHLSLAYWPSPCLTPRAQFSSVSSPQGRNIPYGGTNYYSHSIDDDWSEALLVLRIISRNLYALEYLDLTGCERWFRALRWESEHDAVDWSGTWSKVTELRLTTGWQPSDDAKPSERVAFAEAANEARQVEKHIVAMRAGRGRFINVVRDRTES